MEYNINRANKQTPEAARRTRLGGSDLSRWSARRCELIAVQVFRCLRAAQTNFYWKLRNGIWSLKPYSFGASLLCYKKIKFVCC